LYGREQVEKVDGKVVEERREGEEGQQRDVNIYERRVDGDDSSASELRRRQTPL